MGTVGSLVRRGELRLAIETLAFAAAVPLLFRLPLHRINGMIGQPGRRHASGAIEECAEAAFSLLRFLHLPSHCLIRGTTLYHFLRRSGVDVQLCFGLEADDAARGHCWLERDGLPWSEQRDLSVFTRMYVLPIDSNRYDRH